MLSLVTENQIDTWVRGNAATAQGIIVELIWRLVAASCPKPRERRFPLADSIGQHGPDGIVLADLAFDPFVPEGRSLWEIGTGLKAGDKATSDYRDLTETVPGNVRAESTFIFVTPLSGRKDWEHTWKEDAQAAWLEDRSRRGEWKDVRVIDGTRLVDWVHQFPAVELWFARKMSGLSIQQIEIPEQLWDMVKSIGEPPPLIPNVFLANRDEASRKLKEVLDGTTMQLKLATHFPDQAIDFVCAYLASLDDESRIEVSGRSLILSGAEAWSTVCENWRNFILVADAALDLSGAAGTKLIQKARKAGHAVIFAGPHGGLPDPASVALPMPHSNEIREALEKAGYPEQRARTLADRSGGNLGSLLRLLQNLSVLPAWSERSDAAELAIAAVLGTWTDKSEGDRAVIEGIVGKAYGEWIGKIREIAFGPGTPLIQYEGNWKFIARYEGWFALGPRLFDQNLDKLRDASVAVLQENDPQFELPAEERYAASVHGKVLLHSNLLRTGLAEALALIGSHPKALTSCSLGKAETTAILVVRAVLSNADWVRWASLNPLLPLLAEAAPGEFLDALDKALDSESCPFDALFAQEGKGIAGTNYMTGLLWALETLAWDENHLIRVLVCLGELATHDPGGQWVNRPANSLTTILLPWLPQTCAPIAKRVAAVKALLSELPDIGWKLLLTLLPQHHSASSGTRRPAWRPTIPDDWRRGVTRREYEEQVSSYAELAVTEAKNNVAKLSELIDNLAHLPQSAQNQLLEHLASALVVSLPEADRLRVWSKLIDLVSKHKKFANADWAMKPQQIEKIAALADRLTPGSAFFRHQRLFSDRDLSLYEEKGNYTEQAIELDKRREKAVKDVIAESGIDAILNFAKAVQSAWRVGIAFGSVAGQDADRMVLPGLLETEENKFAQLIGGFIFGRFRNQGWQWVDSLDTTHWSQHQIGQFLAFLPFNRETWERSKRLLKEDESAYWTKTSANCYESETGLDLAIDKLLNYGRPYAAIRCLHKMLYDKQPLDIRRAVRVLLQALKSLENPLSLDVYDVVEIIKALQNDPVTNPDDLFHVEWAYLQLLNEYNEASPKLLEYRLASNPKFFCEVVRLVFRSKKEEQPTEEPTEVTKNIATNAYRLLDGWHTPPGLQKDGTFDRAALNDWLVAVRTECEETGHLEIALTILGQVLIYAPKDPAGLWIHHAASEVLNLKDSEDMRNGFSTELLNSRGVHWVDPTGKQEKEFASKYRQQAEEVEIAGYPRFAATLRSLAQSYEREAERVIAEHNQENFF